MVSNDRNMKRVWTVIIKLVVADSTCLSVFFCQENSDIVLSCFGIKLTHSRRFPDSGYESRGQKREYLLRCRPVKKAV
jgi:hypothetical protein